jgi:ribosome-binding protein aMBF1 (putative translation factor)
LASGKAIGESEDKPKKKRNDVSVKELAQRIARLEKLVKDIGNIVNSNVEKSNRRHAELAQKVEDNNGLVWSKFTEIELGVKEKAQEDEKLLKVK